MKTFMLPALLLLAGLPLAETAQAQGYNVPCETALEINNWRSERSERGYYSARVDLKNISSGPVRVSILYTGPYAMRYPPVTLNPQMPSYPELARPPRYESPDSLKARTTVTCTAGVPPRFQE